MTPNYYDLPSSCQKCGTKGAPGSSPDVLWSGPTYIADGAVGGERLEFACKRCGFRIPRLTVDNRKEQP